MPPQSHDLPFGFNQAGLIQVEIGFLFGDVLKTINTRLDKAMSELGLSQSQWRLLVQVFRFDHPTQTELATAIGIGRAATGALVDQLVASGHLQRQADPQDRRIWRIHPTKLALSQSEEIARRTEATLAPIFSGISQSELNKLRNILYKLIGNAPG